MVESSVIARLAANTRLGYSLDRKFYCDDAVFTADMETVIGRKWIVAGHVDRVVLFSGDGSFRPLVKAVQRRGVRVTVVSTISSQPPIIADELRRQADEFTDLTDLQPRIDRDPLDRPPPREARLHSVHYVHRRTRLKGGHTTGGVKGYRTSDT